MVLRKRHKTARKRNKWMGLLLVEVVRATNEGELPVNQKTLYALVRRKYRMDTPDKVAYPLTGILRTSQLGRIWLRTEGHSVFLFSEAETISNSNAVAALFLAREL